MGRVPRQNKQCRICTRHIRRASSLERPSTCTGHRARSDRGSAPPHSRHFKKTALDNTPMLRSAIPSSQAGRTHRTVAAQRRSAPEPQRARRNTSIKRSFAHVRRESQFRSTLFALAACLRHPCNPVERLYRDSCMALPTRIPRGSGLTHGVRPVSGPRRAPSVAGGASRRGASLRARGPDPPWPSPRCARPLRAHTQCPTAPRRGAGPRDT